MKIKAAYTGLQGKKVAIVVLSDASAYGPDGLTFTVSQALASRLTREGKKITVIPVRDVENWRDRNAWDEDDFIQLGKGVGADKVLAVEISSYSIHEGSTLFKGRSRITTTVYEVSSGQVTFVHGPGDFHFPRTHGRPAIGTDSSQFEAVYIAKMVDYIGRLFYDHEKVEQFADDAIMF